jgi:hypothetical protein
MGVVGVFVRVGVLVAALLPFATGSALARRASLAFGWISSGLTMGASNVLMEGAHGSVWVTTTEGLEHLYTLGRVGRNSGVEPVLMGPGLMQGPDGALWEARRSAAMWGDSEVLRIGRGEARRTLLIEGVTSGMAAGPAGAVWVAVEEGGGHLSHCAGAAPQSAPCVPSIMKLMPDAPAEFFPLPSSMHEMRHMTAGADGNLWFGVRNWTRSGLVRMTPAGELRYRQFGYGHDEEEVHGIAAGPGGIWFTLGAGEVGRISYAGHVSLFSQGIPEGAYPDGLTRGPDGVMWFTQRDANAIGRIDPKGHVTEMPWGKLRVSEEQGTPDGAEQIVSASGRTLLFYRPVPEEFGRLSIDGQCIAPSLVGYHLDEIVRVLHRAGCRLAMRSRYRNKARSVVAAQSTRPGTLLVRGSGISVRTVSPRMAGKRCVPAPAQRKVLADSQFVLFGELLRDEAIQWGAYGQSGPHATKPAMEPWSASWGDGGGGNSVELLVAAGPYLAWQNAWSQGEVGSAGITVLDVPENKVLAEKTIGSYTPVSGSEARALDIALDSEGHVAWRTKIPVHSASPQMQFTEAVETIGEDGQVLTLESGPLGSFAALSFRPIGTLRWISDGQTVHTYTFRATGST